MPVDTTVGTPVRTWFAHPIVNLRALWHDTVWSKVIAGIILGAFGVIGGYVLRSPSAPDRLTSAEMASHHFSLPRCKQATITGHVLPNGTETLAWFEWGETPDLGKVTRKQRFTDEANYYQDLVDLKENTTYFYKVVVSSRYGTVESMVFSFTTARC